MNSLRHLSYCVVLGIVCSFGPHAQAGTALGTDQRDGPVLNALLLHLLADPELDLTTVPTNRAQILLHIRTPEKTGFLQPGQIHGDIRNHWLPDDVERDLRHRNSKPDAKPDTYEAVAAFFTNLTFSSGIVVGDLSGLCKRRSPLSTFEGTYPRARGWLEAYLPGYSEDGTLAIVRAMVGPSAHGATVTALLEKRGDNWVVDWYEIVTYV
jgi:hypothetical protein